MNKKTLQIYLDYKTKSSKEQQQLRTEIHELICNTKNQSYETRINEKITEISILILELKNNESKKDIIAQWSENSKKSLKPILETLLDKLSNYSDIEQLIALYVNSTQLSEFFENLIQNQLSSLITKLKNHNSNTGIFSKITHFLKKSFFSDEVGLMISIKLDIDNFQREIEIWKHEIINS